MKRSADSTRVHETLFFMEESVAETSTEFVLNLAVLSLTAKGSVAVMLAVPVGLVLAAFALRLVRR
jgi:hypothetical protein